MDYETELAVILGRDAKNVTEAEAFDYVFGYTIVNDVSAGISRPAISSGISARAWTALRPWDPVS